MEEKMAHKFDAAELVSSPMKNTSLLLPQILLDEIDRAAVRDDPSSPNRSSWMRRALISALRREAA
jgi:metal-responsive CopG/Arc/MetJ family transcriptional regulator